MRMAIGDTCDVLVVEDDADTQANLRDVLELDDYRVTAVGTVAEALAIRDGDRYVAVILDRCLPDGSAEAVLPQMRQVAPHAAVLIVTGYRDLEGAVACLRAGAADYILKPISPDALRASLRRIAEHRRLERDRQRSEDKFRHLVEAAECLIIIVRADRTICYCGPFAKELIGYGASEVTGRDYLDLLVPPAERDVQADRLERVFAGQTARGVEAGLQTRHGPPRKMLFNARRMEDYEGAAAALIVGHDITQLQAANERAMQAERLAAIGQMMAGLAHESRNALQRSQAALEMLALEIEDRPEALDLVHRALKAQDHLHQLYEEVRGYAAPIQLRRQPVGLRELLEETWSTLSVARQGRQVRLVERLDGACTQIEGDAFALGQVLRNILENALAACPDPGEIRVVAAAASLHGRPAVELRVRDNGPGLNAEQRQRIFEPFYTTKTRGTGLGMAIARRIVEAHGGQIDVGQGPGPGAEIVVTLPRQRP
jgi:PAS domain S-box-containing protein